MDLQERIEDSKSQSLLAEGKEGLNLQPKLITSGGSRLTRDWVLPVPRQPEC